MINVTRSSMPPFMEYCEEIKSLWDSRWLTNMGEKHKQFQAELEKMCSVPNVVLYANGHLALENIITAMNFPKDSEVITTPFTFASTTHAIVRNGLKPVFCDINPEDYTIDVDRIENLITDKTCAIIPVHVYGNICDVDKIKMIAEKHRLKVIYDAAHAFGVEYKGTNIASFGDATMFSFHATKVFNTIEGGAVCLSDEKIRQILNDLKNFGIRGKESCQYIGANAKMNEFQAAMGLCNLRHFEHEVEKRKKVTDQYYKRLKCVNGLKLPRIQEGVSANYAYFPVLFKDYKYSRNEVYMMLAEQDIYARKYFYPLTCDLECYSDFEFYHEKAVPVARYVAENVLTLPLYADLTIEEVDMICDIIVR